MKRKPKKAPVAKPQARRPVAASKPVVARSATRLPELPAPRVSVTAISVETPVPHLLVRVAGVLDETSVEEFFKRVREEVTAAKAKGVLVDLRECKLTLSISDMHGLAKMVASEFSGSVDRLSLLMRGSDILAEKFFEPALTSRGLPTLATSDSEEAVYWLSTKLRL